MEEASTKRQASMSSYLSNLLTHTTSRYNHLRRILLSNEEDGDTEEDSHISRVLRAYYTEKSRPFPPWLGPDPTRSSTPNPSAASRITQAASNTSPGKKSYNSLSDLWDTPANSQAQSQPLSLRTGRRPPTSGGGGAGSLLAAPAPQARPLPSQRAGSYQTLRTQAPSPNLTVEPPSGTGTPTGGGTAQDRLKARLWGGNRSNSSVTLPQASSGNSGGRR
ncbi:hypothetical protein K470DRAFT_107752 [Piedraia hortae CBS 480.64]|uniref:Mso1 N-terminal domain-containing protein n=1 Tax=Piedraia hortae CBS 480.64 TaxID=1314780 RepID=A0A6A7BWY4_9PEZI|nr:hypothetical protein K470DRAFT_107752 [Piedraia hortae CBS 480.64]